MPRAGFFLDLPQKITAIACDMLPPNPPITFNPGMGGSEYQLLLLIQHLLLDTRWDCLVFLPWKSKEKLYEFTDYIYKSTGKELLFRIADDLDLALGCLKRDELDVFIYISIGETIDQIRLLKKSQVPIVAWPTNADWDKGYVLGKISSVRRIVTVSIEQHSTFKYSVAKNKLKVINLFVPLQLMLPPRSRNTASSRIFGSAHEETVTPVTVGFLGALTRYKGIHEFLAIARALLDSRTNCRFAIYGSSNLYDSTRMNDLISPEVLEAVQSRNLRDYVDFKMVIGQKITYLSQCTLAISNPTGAEEFCLSAVEFNQAGVPVLCPPVKGYKTSMQFDCSAFGCSSISEYVAMANEIIAMPLSERSLLRESCIINSMRFAPASIVKQWEFLLDSVIAEVN